MFLLFFSPRLSNWGFPQFFRLLLKFSAHGRNVKVLVVEEFVRVDAISRYPCTLSQLFCWFYLIKVEIEIIDFFLEGIDLTCQWAESRCNQSRHFHRWQHDLNFSHVWGGIFLIHVFILQKKCNKKKIWSRDSQSVTFRWRLPSRMIGNLAVTKSRQIWLLKQIFF